MYGIYSYVPYIALETRPDMRKEPERADFEWLTDFGSAKHGEIRVSGQREDKRAKRKEPGRADFECLADFGSGKHGEIRVSGQCREEKKCQNSER